MPYDYTELKEEHKIQQINQGILKFEAELHGLEMDLEVQDLVGEDSSQTKELIAKRVKALDYLQTKKAELSGGIDGLKQKAEKDAADVIEEATQASESPRKRRHLQEVK